jgi:ABC-2 type transport system ATP-binding protein
MIEVTGLTKTFGTVTALDNLSFKVEKGQVVGFLGANGAGKTTTMDIICGCIGADAGSVKIAGIDVFESPVEAKRRIGYLPDEPPLYTDMRVVDYVAYAATINRVPSSEIENRVRNTILKLSLTEVEHRIIGNLSKGFRQRVGLAQAIVHNPDVLVLDEPTEGLDPNQIVHIRELIQELGGKHTIILSSHILSEVENTCDRIIIINKGKIVQQGTRDELVSMIRGKKQMQIRVKDNVEGALAKLRTLPQVVHAEMLSPKDHRLTLSIQGGDSEIDAIVDALMSGGFGLRELSGSTRALEEVFFELTH